MSCGEGLFESHCVANLMWFSVCVLGFVGKHGGVVWCEGRR